MSPIPKFATLVGFAALLAVGCSPVENRLVNAARNDDVETLRRLAAKPSVDLNRQEEGMLGETPLTAAVLCPATNAFIFLLNSGANIDARNRGGETPLMVACVLGDQGWQKVSLLVKAGADVNAKDTNGFSVLQHAQGAGATQIVQFLIKSGAKTN